MSSWIDETPLTWAQRLGVNIIKAGHVPKHVAFIMDGNRRYAKNINLQRATGHSLGFKKLSEIIHWCLELGIAEVTMYAFSIENFKRSKEEVDSIMGLAKEKSEDILDDMSKIIRDGVSIRIIGNLSYLSSKLRKLIAAITFMTEKNNKLILNLAFSYSSRDEITNSINLIMDGVREGHLDVEDINEQLISNCLYTNKSPDPDLLIRTSGEHRLSDFLLWQISCTQVSFLNILWPELSLWHLLAAIFRYQANYYDMMLVKKAKTDMQNPYSQSNNLRVEKFLKYVEQCRRKDLESYLNV